MAGFFAGLFSGATGSQPNGTTASGYGGQPYGSYQDADKSHLHPYGLVTDRETGWVGTPQELYDRYEQNGMDTSPLFSQFGR